MSRLMKTFIVLSCSIIFLQACGHPEITTEDIERTIVGKTTGSLWEGGWMFEADEPRTISILEQAADGDKAVVTIDMYTSDARGRDKVSGRLRLHYEWAVDAWYLSKIENVTFRQNREHAP